jgi:immune inhibitor A
LRRPLLLATAGAATALLAASINAVPAAAGPRPVSPGSNESVGVAREDNLGGPKDDKRTALRKEAIAAVIAGKATPVQRNGSEVVHLAGKGWVELKQQADKTDPIFTILAQFGDQLDPSTFDPEDETAGKALGPQHNQIAEPQRTDPSAPDYDNSTTWRSDYNQGSYQSLITGKTDSMADFFYKESGGRYSVTGDVTDWVQLQYNEAHYGSNIDDGWVNDFSDNRYWMFVEDSLNAWYANQIAAGKTPAEITAYLSKFDVWDRYDADGDGNFNEADGYIDHFQVIHAGQGEEAGGGTEGTDAIWSHRWSAYPSVFRPGGPASAPFGGAQIGSSGLWVLDYTTEPENGGLGVFTHEYHHDLGLPDLYDTAGGDNGTGFWSLMSGGGWMSKAGALDIGSSPVYSGPWEKLFLGWLDYTVVDSGKKKTVTLGAAGDAAGSLPQAVIVNLPDQTLTTPYNTPHSGSYEWWGGSADNLNTTLTRDLDLTGATTASINAAAWYEIEAGYDSLTGQVSTDGGTTWAPVGDVFDGSSDTDADDVPDWTNISIDLSAYAGQNIKFRFQYYTDGGLHYAGPFLDDIKLVKDGTDAWTDDVETAGAWTANGFTRMTGSTTKTGVPHYYIAENRQYFGYDKSLKSGPYNFGYGAAQPSRVEKFPYQAGLLVWYVNYAYEDNNTTAHPGHGLALPVDARPAPIAWPGCSVAPNPNAGNPNGLCKLGNRRQPYDATFGLVATDSVTFHRNGVALTVPSTPGISTFSDADPLKYWSAANPWSSVQVAGHGTKIQVVLDIRSLFTVMTVKVSN